MSQPDSGRVRIRGCELAYEVVGGPLDRDDDLAPVVWGHGLSSSRADEDRLPLVDAGRLAAHRPVLRYDARGHGASGSLTEPKQGDWAELALDQIALLDHLGVDRAVLAGASMGAATALHAALRLGERVDRIVLVIPPTAWEQRAAQVEMYAQMATVVERNGVDPLIAGLAVAPVPDPLRDDTGWIDRRTAAMRSASPERLAAVFRGAGMADLPAAADLRTIAPPALVLAWTGDPGHPVSTAEQLGDLLPDVEVVITSTADDLASWTDRTLAFLGDR